MPRHRRHRPHQRSRRRSRRERPHRRAPPDPPRRHPRGVRRAPPPHRDGSGRLMDTPTYDAPPEPDYTPRANPIIDAPATHAACARDYENAAGIRATIDKQNRSTR
ncbi:hypothetical protein CP979_26350 [Streptomyces filamentosus]|nr:hypothetical protein CP979_26350 [Streptomyces filamentosus]